MLFSYIELIQYLNPQSITGIIHVGAHICEEANYYHNFLRLPLNNVFWVEGNPETFNIIKSKFNNFNIYEGICTDKTGEKLTFTVTKNKNNNNSTDSSSIFKLGTHLQHHPFVIEEKTIEVTSIKLDDLLSNKNISNVNMLNLDVQGAELLVLKGAENILQNIKYIYTEVNDEELYIGCALIKQLDEYLNSKGFERILTKMTDFKWGDALYIKK
jgi:FkbM family methyltransferase